MPSTAPRSSPRRESSVIDIRRESVWNLVSRFPTPFSPDSAARKSRESRRRRTKPKLEPITIPGSPILMSSFLDMSSPAESGIFQSFKPMSLHPQHPESVMESQSALGASLGSLYNVSLGPDPGANYGGRFIRRPSSEIHLSQVRSYWSDDSSDEDDGSDDNEDRSSPLSPTFLNAWRNRFSGRASMICHRHTRSLPSALTPLSPLSKPAPGSRGRTKPLELDSREEISICQALEDGPVVATVPRMSSHHMSYEQAVEDVALQFGQWRGFSK